MDVYRHYSLRCGTAGKHNHLLWRMNSGGSNMYKLLLVTDRCDVENAFLAVPDWETLDFRAPRVTGSARSAMESLQKHHADGVAIALDDEQTRALDAFLSQNYPLLPILYAPSNVNEVIENVKELRTLLNQLNADNADDRYNEADAMRRARHAYFRQLVRGRLCGRDKVRRMLRMMRSRMDTDQPCVLISFELPDMDEGYLSMRWHYGVERLEIAMRNVFGAELEGMRLLVSCETDDTVCLLACPMLGSESWRDDQSMTGLVTRHAEEAIEHVREYLGIEMRIASITVLPNVTALADPDAAHGMGRML